MGQLKYGDTVCAIGYAFGLKSFRAIKDIFSFEGNGKKVHPIMPVRDQLDTLRKHQVRFPTAVIDIGGGRGDLSLALSYYGIRTEMIEPSPDVFKMVAETRELFDMKEVKLSLQNCTLHESLINTMYTGTWDTIVFSESIEHIEEEEFNKCFPIIERMLRKSKGMLIIVNWIDFHPIRKQKPDHIRAINDTLYDEISKGKEVIFRKGSHLVLQY